jgi:hypothetical protein
LPWYLWIVIVVGGFGSLGLLTALTMASITTILAPRLARQRDVLPEGVPWPTLSVIVPSCNEEDTLEAALTTLLASDYPKMEIVLVNDRSTDATGAIIERMANADSRILPIHIDELPEGWLGKLHAMHRGTQQATGEFLLYSDADVHFEPSALRRAIVWMERDRLGHLAIIPRLVGRGLLYNATISCFAVFYLAAVKAWRIGKEGSESYGGVGAFSMVRRTDFDQSPGWEWLKMEVGDDVGLGMIMVREAGAKSILGIGPELLQIDWYSSVGALVAGLEKNSYGAMCGYSMLRVAGAASMLLGMLVGPFLAVLSPFPALWALAGGVLSSLVVLALVFRRVGQPILASLCCPLGLAVLAGALVRSAFTTERQGGIRWRRQFYPLAELKAGRRVDL